MSTGELLYGISKALASTSGDSLGLPLKTGTKVRQTLGEYYREYSSSSTHELDISYTTISSQLRSLIVGEKSIVEKLGDKLEKFINLASREFINNVSMEALRKGFIRIEDTIIVDTSKDKFRRIRELVNSGFKTTNAYNISKFVQSIGDSLGVSDISVPTTAKAKFGFDIGHVHSNIVSAYGAVVLNSIRRSKIPNDELYSKEVVESLDKLLEAAKDPASCADLMRMAGMTDKDLFLACIDATVGFTKRALNKDLDVVLSIEHKLDRTTIRKIAEQVSDKVFPENAKLQQQFGASFEKSISNHLSSNSKGYFLNFLVNLTRPNAEVNVYDLKGSPSAKDLALDLIENAILGKKSSINTNTTVTVKGNKSTKVVLPSKSKKPSKTEKVLVPKLRNIKGQFTSVINIEALIRARLRETIQKNMVAPRLVNRTGRFASSVKLESVENRQGTLTAFLSYMKYPYATFEPGNKQGSASRSPSSLIDKSVRDIAKSIVTARMKTVIV